MSDKYHRLVTFLVDICPKPLREQLDTKAKADGSTGVPYTTLDAYLQARKSKVDFLFHKGIIRKDQYALIYPSTGSVDVNKWDVTLLAVLLTELFRKQLSPSETKCINDIRDTRNKVQHIANCNDLDDKDFNNYWNILEHSAKSLAKTVGGGSLLSLSSDIREAMNGNMPNLGDVLRIWHLELNAELRQQVTGLEKNVEQIQENDDQLQGNVDHLHDKVDQLQYMHDKVNQLHDKVDQMQYMHDKVDQMQYKLNEIMEQNLQLHEKVDQLQNTLDRQNNGINAVKAESQRKNTNLKKVSVERKRQSGFGRMLGILNKGNSQGYSHLQPSFTDISNTVPGGLHQHVWSVASKQNYNIKMAGEISCVIFGCQLTCGEILLTDYYNKRLKKLDAGYRVVGVCDVPDKPMGVCYIGNNEAVVSLRNNTLQFVDVTGMTLTRSVSTEHECIELTCHGDQLYVTDRNKVYMYSTRGIKQRVLYTRTGNLMYRIVMSDDGSKMYIACESELITIDSSGNLLSTFSVPGLCGAVDVCVDGEGHVLVSDFSGRILQISSDGKHKLGTITDISEDKVVPLAICFDRHKSVLTCAGHSENVLVLQLK